MTDKPSDLYAARVQKGDVADDPAQRAALAAFDTLFSEIAAMPRRTWRDRLFRRKRNSPQGLYIYGPVGRGKTMLMDVCVEALRPIAAVRRVHFHDFMREVHAFLHATRQTTDEKDRGIPAFCRQISKTVQVLAFDEFHVTNIADAMILGRLFRRLHVEGIVCVMTSNRAPQDLYKGGLQEDRFRPFIAHLLAQYRIVALEGAHDYRLQRLRDQRLYMTPLGMTTDQEVQKIFSALTDAAHPHAHEIQVAGRTLVMKGAHGVALTSFADLCEKALGAQDYLAITQTFHTVILQNVPLLTYDRRNEAMRLITLVDIFYDAHVRLIVSAAAPPEKLYTGHDHAFEFERTVSRLLEMQSPEYFARLTA